MASEAPAFGEGANAQSLNQIASVSTTPGIGSIGTFNWNTFGQNLAGMAGRSLVSTAVENALNGGDFEQTLRNNFVSDLAAVGANGIGSQWGSGQNPLLQTAAHGLLGCAAAEAKGGDCQAGAVGGMTESVLGNVIDQFGTVSTSPLGKGLYTGAALLTSSIVADELDLDTVTAMGAAQNAAANNYLNHQQNQARLEAARKCESGDTEACKVRDAWNAYDQKKNDELRNACYTDGASAECSARYADLKLAMNSYIGKSESGAEFASDASKGLYAYTDTAEKDQFKPLLNVPHYDKEAIAKAAGVIKLIGNLAVDMTPGIGDVKAIAEAETRFDYVLAMVGALGPMGDGAKALIKEAKALAEAGDAAKAAEKLAEAEKTLHATAGSTGSWTKELNGKLEPKTAYHLDNGHKYTTDAHGRVNSVEGELSLTTMDRNGYQQCATGKCGEIGDEGGHLIASSLGGAGDKINLVPQASTLNRGDWKAMENELRDALKQGKDVAVKIDVGYPVGGGVRPNEFTVVAYIDGEPMKRTFKQ